MTVDELRKQLENWPGDYEITFAGGLDFFRLKKRDSKMVNMEFDQTVYKEKDGTWRVVPSPNDEEQRKRT
jgi:hypothetical protein